MEKALYPSKYMCITKGYMTDNHKNSYAIDEKGISNDDNFIYSPFTCVVKKVYKSDINEVWIESLDEVLYSDGTVDYMTILLCSRNDISNLFIGKIINQKEKIYNEVNNHCHIVCAKGKFLETSWHRNELGYWSINNEKKPEDSFWIDDNIVILNDRGYNFRRIDGSYIKDCIGSTLNKEENNNKSAKLIFTCKNTDIYAIKLEEGQKLFLQ